MLVDGKWSANWTPVSKTDKKGGFIRPTSSFRNFVGDEGFEAEPGRYHLYVALICPWASRAYQSGCCLIQAWSQLVWLPTQSSITARPRAWAPSTRARRSASVPNSGFTAV